MSSPKPHPSFFLRVQSDGVALLAVQTGSPRRPPARSIIDPRARRTSRVPSGSPASAGQEAAANEARPRAARPTPLDVPEPGFGRLISAGHTPRQQTVQTPRIFPTAYRSKQAFCQNVSILPPTPFPSANSVGQLLRPHWFFTFEGCALHRVNAKSKHTGRWSPWAFFLGNFPWRPLGSHDLGAFNAWPAGGLESPHRFPWYAWYALLFGALGISLTLSRNSSLAGPKVVRCRAKFLTELPGQQMCTT